MPSGPTRRGVLRGLGVGALVTGFDPISRNWVTGQAPSSAVPVPRLKGPLLFSKAALSAAADDFGQIVHRRPWAVLEPDDIDDIVVMLRFCNRHRIQAAARGQGHATFGQAQVKGGLVIEMGKLDKISVAAEMVTAEAGARWRTAAARDAAARADATGADRLPGTVGWRHAVGRRGRRRVTALRGAGRQRARTGGSHRCRRAGRVLARAPPRALLRRPGRPWPVRGAGAGDAAAHVSAHPRAALHSVLPDRRRSDG